MGLWSRISQLVRSKKRQEKRALRGELDTLRRCRFETMEPRRLLAADPLRVGAVYIEEDLGSDLHGDTFEITFEGGATGTELTKVVIDGDQRTPGFGFCDVFFDTDPAGNGADNALPFQLTSFTSANPNASVTATVSDGSSLLTLDLVGFKAGDKLVFSIDVDEVIDFDPNETDQTVINDGFDPLTSGVEFQGSMFTAHFSVEHYHDISGGGEFRNHYDDNLNPLDLNLPADDAGGRRDRSDGVGIQLTQEPVLAEISGYVYHDRDDDGSRDPGEEGLANVTIQVVPVNTIEPQSTVTVQTDANGFYHAPDLIPGSYRVVEVTQPTAFFDGLDAAGTVRGTTVGAAVNPGDSLQNIFLGGGDSGVEYNFGEIAPASIRGRAHLTDPDGNCFSPGGSGQPLQDVTLRLMDAQGLIVAETKTDANGEYEFTGLHPGEYSVVEVTPADLIDGDEHVGSVNGRSVGQLGGNDVVGGIVLGSGMAGVEYNFCEHEPASLSGFVYHDENDNGTFDAGEDPSGNTLVTLQDKDGNVVATQQTQPDGGYQFTGLRAGEYVVVESQPSGWIDGKDAAGNVRGTTVGQAGNDRIEQVSLKWGDDGVHYDFGELRPVSISGFVYHDRANNGDRDPGDEGIEGVTLQVIPVNPLSVQQTVTVTTDANGFYEATGLVPGEYRVVEQQPATYQDGTDVTGNVDGQTRGAAVNPGDSIEGIQLVSGDAGVQYNFGEYRLASVSGNVHVSDPDGNCFVRGPATPGIADVGVTLLDANGATVAETRTNANGDYSFAGLQPGTYTVVEQTPDRLIDGAEHVGEVGGNGRGQLDGNDRITGIALASGEEGVAYDFCEHQPASLAGNVYHDGNDNGVLEQGEDGTGNVEVVLQDASGNAVATTRTASDGSYQFTGLRAATYTVVEGHPDGWRDGKDTVGTINGRVVGTGNNDQLSNVTLRWGEAGVEYNFGEFLSSSIAGVVHAETDGNCNVEPGEIVLEGVTVELLDAAGDVIQTTQTNANGEYRFDGLVPGEYSVRELQPGGYFHGGQVVGSGGGNQVGNDLVQAIAVGSGQHLVGYNFCETPPAQLSGYVFQDGDTIETADGKPPANLSQIRDGQRTPDDTPIAEVVLELRDGRTGITIDASQTLNGTYPAGAVRTTTDTNGFYEFTGLQGGREYAVYQIHPDGFFDHIDTPGTTTGQAFNVGQLVNQGTLQQLAEPPRNDAIVRIFVDVGGDSENNNFSEVKVEHVPDTPPLGPPTDFPPLPIPPLNTPPLLRPAPAAASIAAPLLNVYAGGVEGSIGYTWHLSVINAGMPRDFASAETNSEVWRQARYLDYTNWEAERMREAQFTLVVNQDDEDNVAEVRQYVFGLRGGIPISGDFDGDGVDEIGVYYQGEWFIDLNGNGVWDQQDLWAKLGGSEDLPVTGDWDGDGKDDIGIYGPEWLGDPRALDVEPGLPDSQNVLSQRASAVRPKNVPPVEQQATDGRRLLQLNEQGPRRVDVIDHVFRFGAGKDVPVTGDWNGDGIRSIGIFRDGSWQLDLDGDGRWSRHDAIIQFGQPGDIPVVGDFDGNGIDQVGVYRAGQWLIDSGGNRELDAHDKVFEMGGASDLPVVGDWDGDGVDEPGIHREINYQPDAQVRN
ncbi:MAG: hypothetical protein CMJ64_00260 [Planctomycetaceae bacterium]|nr:hypothetical protein [Planctomycetaceae bacterium]